jgi:shikimate kinase
MGKRVFILGYMGSGKSSNGKLLAKQLQLEFLDLDELIKEGSGKSAGEWINQYGELKFRQIERETLLNTLDKDNYVLATGGGTPCYYDNLNKMLESGLCIYLDAPPKVLSDRLLNARKNRPLIDQIPDEELTEFVAKHLFERRAFYQKAHLRFSALNPQAAEWAKSIELFWGNQDK